MESKKKKIPREKGKGLKKGSLTQGITAHNETNGLKYWYGTVLHGVAIQYCNVLYNGATSQATVVKSRDYAARCRRAHQHHTHTIKTKSCRQTPIENSHRFEAVNLLSF